GDRRARLMGALSGLSRLRGTRLLGRSPIYETAPVGPRQGPYLNLAARIRTELSPMGLLCELKRLETLAGRVPGPRSGARPLDTDILSYGSARVRTPWLTVPHPRAAERAFVLAPLSRLAPGWKPDGKATVLALLRRLNPGPGTVKIWQEHGR